MKIARVGTCLLSIAIGAASTSLTVGAWADQTAPITVPTTTARYQVNAGDTLGQIAESFHTTVKAIAALNGLSDPNQIVAGQTLQVPATIPGLPPATKALVCELTAYTSDYASTGKLPGDPGYGITATGDLARQGYTVAVDPSVIPYGTTLYIPGLGMRVADDTGGAIIGNHIDVYYQQNQAAIDFGVKPDVVVYVLPGRRLFAMRALAPRYPASNRSHVTLHKTSATHEIANRAIPTVAKDIRVQVSHLQLRDPLAPVAAHMTSLRVPAHPSVAARPHLGHIDVLDVWTIMLDRYLWQPILTATKHRL